eukprot:579167-Pleurochrysis_carterae.AAC.1
MSILGIMIVNSYVLFKYFVSETMYDEIKGFLSAAAYDGLQNHFDVVPLPRRISPASSSGAA